MSAHRFRDLVASPVHRISASVQASPAFVACPMALLGSLAPEQQAYVHEMLRSAWDQSHAVMAPPRLPEFSMN